LAIAIPSTALYPYPAYTFTGLAGSHEVALSSTGNLSMVKKYNVLVFPGGTEIGLEIQKALCQQKDITLWSVGLDSPNHAPYVFAQHFIVPSIHNPDWITELNQIIVAQSIDYIFPAYDDVMIALVNHASELKARIISSPQATCLISRSKTQTYHLLKDVIPVPRLYQEAEVIETYPVFIKPDKGQGSQNTHLVETQQQLDQLSQQTHHDYIVMEYLPGEEYTVDCFSDRDRGLLFCGGRKRVRVRSGISVNSYPVHNPIFQEYAEKISQSLSFHGAWFFQLKQDPAGVYKLLEVAPRIAGTMALNRVLGVNFPLMSLYEQERIPLQILFNPIELEVDRALVNHYRHSLQYAQVYVDLDDTLILNDKVNTTLVRFLYQCINKNIRIALITKHAGNLDETLKRHRISELFDEVIHISKSSSKSDAMSGDRSIFIDDSFSERLAVSQRLGIMTFDCSMLEMLLDERV
jgi:carbamoyl-phosphate synthase large subunit